MDELDIDFEEADLSDYAPPFSTPPYTSYNNRNMPSLITGFSNKISGGDSGSSFFSNLKFGSFAEPTKPTNTDSKNEDEEDNEHRLVSFRSSSSTKSAPVLFKKLLNQPESAFVSRPTTAMTSPNSQSQYFRSSRPTVEPVVDNQNRSLKSTNEIRNSF
jgi:hypothetical protein